MRVAHCSDLHLLSHDGAGLRELANKRWIGAANLLTNRSRHYHVEAFEQMVDDLNALGIEHVLCTGDVTNLALEREFRFAKSKFDKLSGGPDNVTVIPGNHDAYVADGIAYFAEIFGAYHTSDPGWDWARGDGDDDAHWPIVRVRGDVALIGLTTSRPTAWFSAYGYCGELQLRRLRQALLDDRLAGKFKLVAIHHPPAGRRAKNAIRGLHDHEAFAAVIRDHGADLVVHGHEHRDMVESLPGPKGPVTVRGIASGTYEHGDPERTARYRIYEIAHGALKAEIVRVWNRQNGRFDNASPREIPPAST